MENIDFERMHAEAEEILEQARLDREFADYCMEIQREAKKRVIRIYGEDATLVDFGGYCSRLLFAETLLLAAEFADDDEPNEESADIVEAAGLAMLDMAADILRETCATMRGK